MMVRSSSETSSWMASSAPTTAPETTADHCLRISLSRTSTMRGGMASKTNVSRPTLDSSTANPEKP